MKYTPPAEACGGLKYQRFIFISLTLKHLNVLKMKDQSVTYF